jgi:hypothetical protein
LNKSSGASIARLILYVNKELQFEKEKAELDALPYFLERITGELRENG